MKFVDFLITCASFIVITIMIITFLAGSFLLYSLTKVYDKASYYNNDLVTEFRFDDEWGKLISK